MPRSRMDMSPETREELSAMDDAVVGEVPEGTDLAAIEESVGRQELTARMAGTTDRGSRAWKSARDALTRWRSGRRGIGGRSAARLRQAARGAAVDSRRGQPLSVSASVSMRVSSRWWAGSAAATLTGGDADAFLDALANGDHETAAGVFLEDGYLNGQSIAELGSFDGFEFGF